MSGRNQRVYTVVRALPEGCVATYKQVAQLAGISGRAAARQVGYALRQLNEDDVPWHRVINAKGELSQRANPDSVLIQRDHLSEEGVEFDHRGKIDLSRYGWHPYSK